MTETVRPKVYVSRRLNPSAWSKLKEKCDLKSWDENTLVPRHVLLAEIEDVDGLYSMGHISVDEELLSRAKRLRVIVTMSAGYNHIDVDACRKRGILLGHTPDVLTEACAELGVALILCTARRLIEANLAVYNGGWQDHPGFMTGRGIFDSIVGIVGLGRIGSSIAEKLKAFHPKEIVYHNRQPSERGNALGCTYMHSLDDLMRCSDFVIACCPLTPQTMNLFNGEKFALMKPTAMFFNFSRGRLVDHEALYEALATKRILAAGLDVCTPEPLPRDHKLLTLSNIVILPHISTATHHAQLGMATLAAENLLAGLEGRQLPAEIPFS